MSKHESLCDALDALTDKEGYPIPYTGTAASVIRNQDAEIERLRAALERIAALESHRHPCCPTNMPKHIAREALRDE